MDLFQIRHKKLPVRLTSILKTCPTQEDLRLRLYHKSSVSLRKILHENISCKHPPLFPSLTSLRSNSSPSLTGSESVGTSLLRLPPYYEVSTRLNPDPRLNKTTRKYGVVPGQKCTSGGVAGTRSTERSRLRDGDPLQSTRFPKDDRREGHRPPHSGKDRSIGGGCQGKVRRL